MCPCTERCGRYCRRRCARDAICDQTPPETICSSTTIARRSGSQTLPGDGEPPPTSEDAHEGGPGESASSSSVPGRRNARNLELFGRQYERWHHRPSWMSVRVRALLLGDRERTSAWWLPPSCLPREPGCQAVAPPRGEVTSHQGSTSCAAAVLCRRALRARLAGRRAPLGLGLELAKGLQLVQP